MNSRILEKQVQLQAEMAHEQAIRKKSAILLSLGAIGCGATLATENPIFLVAATPLAVIGYGITRGLPSLHQEIAQTQYGLHKRLGYKDPAKGLKFTLIRPDGSLVIPQHV